MTLAPSPHTSYPQIPEFKWHIFEDKVPIDVADSGILITPFEGGTACYLINVVSDTGYSSSWASMVNESAACVHPYTSLNAIDARTAFYAEIYPLFLPGTTRDADRTTT